MNFQEEIKKYSIAECVELGFKKSTVESWRRTTNPTTPATGMAEMILDRLFVNRVEKEVDELLESLELPPGTMIALADYYSEGDFILAKPNQDWRTEKEFNRLLAAKLPERGYSVGMVPFDWEDYSQFIYDEGLPNNSTSISQWAAYNLYSEDEV